MTTSLKDEVESLLAAQSSTKNDPPQFNNEELLIMALVHRGPMNRLQMIKWINQNIAYYRHFETAYMRRLQLDNELTKAFQRYDMPISPLHEMNVFTADFSDTKLYKVSLSEARIFLRRVLKPRPDIEDRPFRFLDLPAELRNNVYSMVLGLPRGGICIERSDSNSYTRILTFQRSLNTPTCRGDWPNDPENYPEWGWQCGLSCHILAILLVNRQIHKEALPVFYGINHFAFWDLEDLVEFLERTPLSRKEHLGHLSFEYPPYDLKYAKGAFDELAALKSLRRLEICISESMWAEYEEGRGVPRSADIHHVPGLETLENMPGLKEVNFYGDCANIRNHFVDSAKIRNLFMARMTKSKLVAA